MQLQGDGPTPTEPVDHSFEQWKTEMQISFDKWKTEQDNAVKVTIAQMSQQTTMDTTTMGIEAQSNAKVSEQLGPVMEQMAAVHAHMTAPRKKVRDESGKLIGVDINGTVVPITEMETTTMGIDAQNNATVSEQLAPVMEQMAGLEQGLQAVYAHMTGPRKKVRDASGKLIGVDINGTVVPITE